LINIDQSSIPSTLILDDLEVGTMKSGLVKGVTVPLTPEDSSSVPVTLTLTSRQWISGGFNQLKTVVMGGDEHEHAKAKMGGAGETRSLDIAQA
jgi:hypothetical protein